MLYCLIKADCLESFRKWTPEDRIPTDKEKAFGCIPGTNPVRQACRNVVNNRHVQSFWFSCVLLSTALTLAVQPRYQYGKIADIVLLSVQAALLAFFWFRMLLEIIARGVVIPRHAFLRQFWNVVEVVVNVFGVLQLIPPTNHIRWMRAFAALRPVRWFLWVPTWRRILVTFVRLFPRFFDVMVSLLLGWMTLAAIGVIAVSDRLSQRCYVTSVVNTTLDGCDKVPCLLLNVTRNCGTGFVCPTIAPGVEVTCMTVSSVSGGPLYFNYRHIGSALLVMLRAGTSDHFLQDVEQLMNANGSGAALLLVTAAFLPILFFSLALALVYHATTNVEVGRGLVVLPPPPMEPIAPVKRSVGAQTEITSSQLYSSTQRSWRGALSSLAEESEDPKAAVPGPLNEPSSAATLSAEEFEPRAVQPPDSAHTSPLKALLEFVAQLERTTGNPSPTKTLPLVRHICVHVVNSAPCAVTLLVLGVANVVLLAVMYVGMPESIARHLMQASSAIAIAFAVPILLRCVGFGVRATLCDLWNYADVAGVVSGVLELAVPSIFNYHIVRALRVLRVARIGKYIAPFQPMRYGGGDLLAALTLLAVVLVLYALLGMQLFSDSYVAPPNVTGDFSTMWTALLLCFTMFTGADWSGTLGRLIETGTPVCGVLYMIAFLLFAYIIAGNYVLAAISRVYWCHVDAQVMEEDTDRIPPPLLLPPVQDEEPPSQRQPMLPLAAKGSLFVESDPKREEVSSSGSGDKHRLRRFQGSPSMLKGWIVRRRELRVFYKSLNYFAPTDPLRQALLYVLGSPLYWLVSTMFVLLGVVALFFEERHPTPRTSTALHVTNIVYVVFFWIEMIVKWIAYGVCSRCVPHEAADAEVRYSRDAQQQPMPVYFGYYLNWVDFITNGLCFGGLFYPPLRVGRAFRTIRVFTSQEHPNYYAETLLRTLVYALQQLPLLLTALVFFALLGAQVFSDSLHECTDPSVTEAAQCSGKFKLSVTTYFGSTTVQRERHWKATDFNYDNLGEALLSMFVLSTDHNWTLLMQQGMNAATGARALSYNHSAYYVVFFLAVAVFIRLLALNTIMAIFAAHFARLQSEMEDFALGAPSQITFARTKAIAEHMLSPTDLLVPLRYRVSQWMSRVLQFRLIARSCPVEKWVVGAYVLVHCGFVAARHTDNPPWLTKACEVVDVFGIVLYGMECITFAVAWGWRQFLYFRFTFDVVVVLLLIIALAVPGASFLRVVVFIKLWYMSELTVSLHPLFQRRYYLASVFGLFMGVLIAYAVVGTLMFGSLHLDGVGLTAKKNFSTVIGSLLVLFGCSTTDSWAKVMLSCAQDPSVSGCVRGSAGEDTCGHRYMAIPFFVTFIFFIRVIILQLAMAVVLAGANETPDNELIQALLDFEQAWRRRFGSVSEAVEVVDFVAFIPTAPHFLTGLPPVTDKPTMVAFLSSLRLPLDTTGRIHYPDVVNGLICRKYKVEWHKRLRHLEDIEELSAGYVYSQQDRNDAVAVPDKAVPSTIVPFELYPMEGSQKAPFPRHHEMQVRSADMLVPPGAKPIGSSNVFLFGLPSNTPGNEDSLSR